MLLCKIYCFYGNGDHRDLYILTHSFPTRRSSDLGRTLLGQGRQLLRIGSRCWEQRHGGRPHQQQDGQAGEEEAAERTTGHGASCAGGGVVVAGRVGTLPEPEKPSVSLRWRALGTPVTVSSTRSEEHTSELQSLMRISYAVFCLNKKNTTSIILLSKC